MPNSQQYWVSPHFGRSQFSNSMNMILILFFLEILVVSVGIHSSVTILLDAACIHISIQCNPMILISRLMWMKPLWIAAASMACFLTNFCLQMKLLLVSVDYDNPRKSQKLSSSHLIMILGPQTLIMMALRSSIIRRCFCFMMHSLWSVSFHSNLRQEHCLTIV